MRSDAQIFYVFDISNSMRASHGPHSPTRLERALAIARRMRLDLTDVPSGVATMTDRVLPNIFPTGDEQLFAAALAETVGVERPPPKGFDERATTFAALDTFAGDNFFSRGIKHRVVVLLTDGETAPYFGGDLRESLRLPPRAKFVIVRMGGQGERIWVNGTAGSGLPAGLERGTRDRRPGGSRRRTLLPGRTGRSGDRCGQAVPGHRPARGSRPRVARDRARPVARPGVSAPAPLPALDAKCDSLTAGSPVTTMGPGRSSPRSKPRQGRLDERMSETGGRTPDR